jgi:rhodanese-related sulfurtransferase
MTTSTTPPPIAPNLTMGELLAAFPSARRALFQRYHIGGCASCGFRQDETLAEVCSRNGGVPVEEAIEHILSSHESDRRLQVEPAAAAELVRAGRARLVDVRTREEFDAVHVEGSTFFTQELMHELSGWDRETLIIFVDHQGTRNLDAAAYFSGHGLENVRALRGGIDAWSREVDPSLPRYELE